MSRFEELQKTFDKLKAKLPSAAQAELHATEKETLQVSHHQGKLDKFAFSQSHAASIRIVLKGCQGLASTEDLSESALQTSFQQALANAELLASSSPDKDFVLPKPVAGFSVQTPTSRLASLSPEEKIAISARSEAAALGTDKRIKAVPYSSYNEHLQRRYVFNSHGVALSDESSACRLHCYPLAEENGESKMAYSPALMARDPRDIKPEAFAKRAALASLAKLNPKSVSTGRYQCVVSSKAMEEFFSPFESILSGETIFERTSPYSDKLGKAVASSKLTLSSDPMYASSLRQEAFDDEGTPTRRVDLIQKGVFRTPLTNSRWATKLGLENTGSAQRPDAHGGVSLGFGNLVVGGGSASFDELLNRAPKVLWIDEFDGFAGFNRTTGNFSIPASGFLVENGKAVQPVDNFLVSGNIFDFLNQIEEIGSDVQSKDGEIFAPSMLVSNVSIAGA